MIERMRRNEREQMILLYAMLMMIQNARDSLKNTLTSRTSTGWRDIRLIETILDKMTTELFDTVPKEQLQAIYADVKNSSIQVRVKAAGSVPDSIWHLETGQIATLVNHAVLGCMTCDNTTGKGCGLKKILEELPLEISGDGISMYMACAERLEVHDLGPGESSGTL